MKKYIAYFDGACGPNNPGGDVGVGAAIYDVSHIGMNFYKHGFRGPIHPDWKEMFTYSKFYRSYELGMTSNNVAEYLAFHQCVIWAKSNCSENDEVLFIGDSKLVVSQMTGKWRIKEGIYKESAIEAAKDYNKLKLKTKYVAWTPREFNTKADSLSKLEGTFNR